YTFIHENVILGIQKDIATRRRPWVSPRTSICIHLNCIDPAPLLPPYGRPGNIYGPKVKTDHLNWSSKRDVRPIVFLICSQHALTRSEDFFILYVNLLDVTETLLNNFVNDRYTNRTPGSRVIWLYLIYELYFIING